MANNNERRNSPVNDQKSLAENIGVSNNLEDFGGGRGQAAGTQTSAASQDQFSEDVEQIFDEDDFEEVEPKPPVDYFDDEEKE